MPHFNQSHAPILSKFRTDDTTGSGNGMNNKYNGHSNSHSTNPSGNNHYTANVPSYTAQHQLNIDDKHRIATTYQQTGTTNTAINQSQAPEITQVSSSKKKKMILMKI